MKIADFWQKTDSTILCTLCPHHCKLKEREFGICGVRQVKNGELVTHVYECAIATHVDPIEKKPLFHVYPGSRSFSVATVGCNFKCGFCQNHEISQIPANGYIGGQDLPVESVVDLALDYGCKTIACTYTEPTIYFEYAYDIAKLAAERGIETVFISNGYTNPKPLEKIAPFLTAANIDLKGWSDSFYDEVIGGELKPVLNALKKYRQLGIFIEVTTLVVSGHVDNEDSLRDIAKFIKNELGEETPWHLSRFYPQFDFDHVSPTSSKIIARGREIGFKEGLRYVYSGNLPGDAGENTFCWKCGAELIHRRGYQILENKIQHGQCPECRADIDGVGL